MIKKSLLLLLVVLFCQSAAFSQTEQGKWFINPQLTALDISGIENSFNDHDRFKFGFGLKGGNFITKNLATIVGFGFQVDKQSEEKNNNLYLSAGVRYYLFSKLILGGDLGYEKVWKKDLADATTRKRDYFLMNLEVGYAIFLSENVALEPSVYWKYSFADRYNQYGLKLGIGVYF